MDRQKVPAVSAAVQIAGLLASEEIAGLVAELEATCWTGRPGYPVRSMVGMALAKSLYAIPTWTGTVRLVADSELACYPLHREAPRVQAAAGRLH